MCDALPPTLYCEEEVKGGRLIGVRMYVNFFLYHRQRNSQTDTELDRLIEVDGLTDRSTGGWMDGRPDGQTHSQTDRQTDTQSQRLIDKQKSSVQAFLRFLLSCWL